MDRIPSLAGIVDSIRARIYGHRYQIVVDQSIDHSTSRKSGSADVRSRRYYIGAICSVITLALILLYQLSNPFPRDTEVSLTDSTFSIIDGPYVKYRTDAHWHGWSSLSRMIVFGDSWSMTGFHPNKTRPSPENPLGNPEYPGATSTNGANWIDYLTYNYNESVILTANFAMGGATVDESLIEPPMPHYEHMRGGLKAQVQQFESLYADSSLFDWSSQASLFVIWIGINDVHEVQEEEFEPDELFPHVFRSYAVSVDRLHQLGARNFMFVTVPPIEKAPIAAGRFDEFAPMVSGFNANVTRLVWNFTATYEDVSTFLFDAHELLDDVIRDPCTLPISCGLETVKYCLSYSFATITEDPECEHTIDGYLWMNPLHPTTVTHDAIAYAAVRALKAPLQEDEVPEREQG